MNALVVGALGSSLVCATWGRQFETPARGLVTQPYRFILEDRLYLPGLEKGIEVWRAETVDGSPPILCAYEHGRAVPLVKPEQLRGRVEISSPESALSFVRLFTNQSVFSYRYEAIAKPSVDLSYCFFDRYAWGGANTIPVHQKGVLTGPEAAALRASPSVKLKGKSYVISRLLIELDAKDRVPQLARVSEMVGPGGEYRVLKHDVLDVDVWKYLDVSWGLAQ